MRERRAEGVRECLAGEDRTGATPVGTLVAGLAVLEPFFLIVKGCGRYRSKSDEFEGRHGVNACCWDAS